MDWDGNVFLHFRSTHLSISHGLIRSDILVKVYSNSNYFFSALSFLSNVAILIFFFVIIYRQVKVFVIPGGLLYDKVTSTARNNYWSLVTFYRFTWIFWNQYKHCSYMQYLVRPQFVDTLFIIRLRPNMSMHLAVISNY